MEGSQTQNDSFTSLLKLFDLEESDFCAQVSDLHLDEFARSCCTEWKSLPIYLDVERIVASDVDHSPGGEREKRLSFFNQWKQRKGCDATYKTLVCALLKINLRQDAEHLCNLLLKKTTALDSATTATAAASSESGTVSSTDYAGSSGFI